MRHGIRDKDPYLRLCYGPRYNRMNEEMTTVLYFAMRTSGQGMVDFVHLQTIDQQWAFLSVLSETIIIVLFRSQIARDLVIDLIYDLFS